MLHRPWSMPLVVLFWMVTSGWLLVTKILPSLAPGSPPGHQAFYTADNRLVPVAWTVLWNDRPLGWATSQAERMEEGGIEVESLLHFDRLPINEVLPPWAKRLLPPSFNANAAYPLDARGRLSIDQRGDLRSFSSTVSLPATEGSVFLDGRIDKAEVTVDVRANGISYTSSQQLPGRLTIRDELSPQAMLPGLYQNRQWTVPVYSPLRAGRAPIQILRATVVGQESIVWEDQLVRVDIVHYLDDSAPHHDPICRLWVDRSGRVLKQESLVLGAKLIFVRRSDKAAADLIAASVSPPISTSVSPAEDKPRPADESASRAMATGEEAP